MKYILVTGGVASGIGKGIVASSIGALLRAANQRVTAIKIDPYLNVGAGCLSPYEHGEVFVLDDGSEVDLDFGNYERFLDSNLSGLNSITTGKINKHILNLDERGEYLGKTIQIIPHMTNAIQESIEKAAHNPLSDGHVADICIIELGGTIGDMEGMPFVEALRQLQDRIDKDDFCCCMVSLVPVVGPSKEQKSKPTQNAVKLLRSLNLSLDMILCRSESALSENLRDKIYTTCGVRSSNVYSVPDLDSIYQVPLELHRQGMPQAISARLKIGVNTCDCRLKNWRDFCEIAIHAKKVINVALVGKYTELKDSYISVAKALQYACYVVNAKPKIHYIDSTLLERHDTSAWNSLKTSDCLVVPGGFGMRGVEGMIRAIEWARNNRQPFLGVCLGFQMAVIEFARHVLGIKNAHSDEFEPELRERDELFEPIVTEMLEYIDPERKLGGTMRCGLRKTVFVKEDSILKRLYGGKKVIEERHRHRYEIDSNYVDALEAAGLKFVAKNEDGRRMEILELDEQKHPYFVGVQFHPEYLSRPFNPSPPYKGLICAAIK